MFGVQFSVGDEEDDRQEAAGGAADAEGEGFPTET